MIICPFDTIVALRSVHDYLKFHDLKTHEVEMTKDVLASCRQARKNYFDNQQSKALSAEKTEKLEARSKVNEDNERRGLMKLDFVLRKGQPAVSALILGHF